jgi:uncharacterized membrane protein
MKLFLISYVITLVVFAAIDFIWLGTMANVLYRPVLGDMLAPEFRLLPAVAFYLLFIFGLTFFAVRPALATGDLLMAAVYGGILGLTAYATYDLTNQATLRNWSTLLTVADLAWGTTLSALAATAATWATHKWFV